MKNLTRTILSTLAVGLLISGLMSQQAHAVPLPLPASGSVFPPPGGVVGGPVAGALVSSPFSSGGAPASRVDGIFNSMVFNDPTNVLGGLTFVYEVQNNGAGLAAIERFTMSNFAGFTVAVEQAAAVPGGGVVGTKLIDIANRSASGDVVGGNFNPATPLTNGTNSFWLIVRTNALGFFLDSAGIIDGRVASADAWLPTGPAAVPDGGSAVALLGIALAGIEGVRRMIRARKA